MIPQGSCTHGYPTSPGDDGNGVMDVSPCAHPGSRALCPQKKAWHQYIRNKRVMLMHPAITTSGSKSWAMVGVT